MAKKKSMTMEEAIQAILASEEDTPLRMMLEFMVQSVLEWEMTEHVGAGPYERTEERKGYRNGYKPRTLTTAVGDLNPLVPQDRDGILSMQLFERYKHSDRDLPLTLVLHTGDRRVALVCSCVQHGFQPPLLLSTQLWREVITGGLSWNHFYTVVCIGDGCCQR